MGTPLDLPKGKSLGTAQTYGLRALTAQVGDK